MTFSSAHVTPAQQADSLMHEIHRVQARKSAAASGQGASREILEEVVPFSPPCRLRLEGGVHQDATCEILELSAEGVNIVITGGSSVCQGQHGRLLIGPPEGDHYELPVDVSWVKPASSIAVLGLSLPTPPNWRFSRT
ncbi:MAG: hypothetical protein VKM17_11845 [Cyanobacteriota bacterium]|nr:hypothetical protein [Cyanobacteriota bacterium]